METRDIPTALQQFKNVGTGALDVKRAHPESFFFGSILVGINMLMPDEMKESLARKERIETTRRLFALQMALNDEIDYTFSGRDDIDNLIEQSRAKTTLKRADLSETFEKIEDPAEKTRGREISKNAEDELKCVETYARQHNLSTDGAIMYRRLVNAINTCSEIAILFGPHNLDNRLNKIDEDNLNWKTISEKYSWIFDNKPENKLEKVIIIMDRMMTAVQLVDDWYGRDVDATLNVPSPAITLLKEDGSQQMAKLELTREKDNFLKGAQEMGVNILSVKAADSLHKWMQKLNLRLTNHGRKNTPILGSFARKRMMSRERAYANWQL